MLHMLNYTGDANPALQEGNLSMQNKWETADGRIIVISDLDSKHLINIIHKLRAMHLKIRKRLLINAFKRNDIGEMNFINNGNVHEVLLLDAQYCELYNEAIRRNLFTQQQELDFIDSIPA